LASDSSFLLIFFRFGGIKGQTKLTISGANLASSSLFTETLVYVGNTPCEVIGHSSTSESLICLTPACSSDSCQSGNIQSGSTVVDIRIYVSTVEGILTPETIPKFVYYNSWTPAIFWMHSSTWATASTPLIIRSDNILLTAIDVLISSSHASLGTNGELNSENLPGNLRELTLYYRPPLDLSGGFHNLSLVVQDDFTYGSSSTGQALTFEKDRYDTSVFSRFYLYQSTLRGTSYSLCLYPTIFSVTPSLGSYGGGTLVTITGAGFSTNKMELHVFAHGSPCLILSSTLTQIICQTTSINTSMNDHNPRRNGSPGWWMRVWSDKDFLSPLPEKALLSFRWTQKFYFSFTDYYGSTWPTSALEYENMFPNNRYLHDAATVFTASYSGYYQFYIASDDISYLYASDEGIEINEILLAYNPSYASEEKYYKNPKQQISSLIPLKRGEKLYLRFRNVSL
jgi:hypothetical protein